MDIDRIRYFHVFAEIGSLVGASEVLHISQPALSKALRLLEHEVGAKLTESEGRGLRLTKAGHLLKKETGPLLEQWLNLPTRLRSQESIAPTKIGSFEVFTTYFLSRLTQSIQLESLQLHEYGPGRLEQAILDGTIDIGITYAPIPKAGIDFIEVCKIRMGAFGIKKFKNVSLPDLPFVIPLQPTEGTPSKVIGLDGWPDNKFQRNVKYKVTLMESALQLCRLGLGIAYLPAFVVELHNESVIPDQRLLELQVPISHKDRLQSVFMIHRKHEAESPLLRQLAKCLRTLD